MTTPQLEQLVADCLAGRAKGGGDLSPERAREVVEKRVQGCWHVAGQSPGALAQSEPDRYEQWLRGTRAALLREYVSGGGVSATMADKDWRN